MRFPVNFFSLPCRKFQRSRPALGFDSMLPPRAQSLAIEFKQENTGCSRRCGLHPNFSGGPTTRIAQEAVASRTHRAMSHRNCIKMTL